METYRVIERNAGMLSQDTLAHFIIELTLIANELIVVATELTLVVIALLQSLPCQTVWVSGTVFGEGDSSK